MSRHSQWSPEHSHWCPVCGALNRCGDAECEAPFTHECPGCFAKRLRWLRQAALARVVIGSEWPLLVMGIAAASLALLAASLR